MSSLASLLVLADGRLPAGAHAHSGGIEEAVGARRVQDVAALDAFLRGRLDTVGVVAAAFAAAACARPADLADLDAGLDARTPSPALRRASRAQGRALLRAARAIWPAPSIGAGEPHHPVAVGQVAAVAGLGPREAAVAAAHGVLTGPATAAVRLLGLDPFRVHALLARLAPDVDRIAAEATARRHDPVDDLPADSAPLLDLGAEHHATWEVRLFAS
jgi:urease accessory protein